VQNPATGLLASDPDDVHEGIDGRDFHLTWTPSDAADAVSQDIYIVPTGTDLSTGSQAAAKSFADTTTTSWTGTAADDVTTDATGAEFDPYEDYKLYVVTTDDDGDSSISAGAEWTSEVPNPVLDISFSDPDDSTIGVTGEDFSLNWTVSGSPDVIKQEIYILPYGDMTTNGTLDFAASLPAGDTSWQGTSDLTTDATGGDLTDNVTYDVYVVPWSDNGLANTDAFANDVTVNAD